MKARHVVMGALVACVALVVVFARPISERALSLAGGGADAGYTAMAVTDMRQPYGIPVGYAFKFSITNNTRETQDYRWVATSTGIQVATGRVTLDPGQSADQSVSTDGLTPGNWLTVRLVDRPQYLKVPLKAGPSSQGVK